MAYDDNIVCIRVYCTSKLTSSYDTVGRGTGWRVVLALWISQLNWFWLSFFSYTNNCHFITLPVNLNIFPGIWLSTQLLFCRRRRRPVNSESKGFVRTFTRGMKRFHGDFVKSRTDRFSSIRRTRRYTKTLGWWWTGGSGAGARDFVYRRAGARL